MWSRFFHRASLVLAVSVCVDGGRRALEGAKPHTPGFCRAALGALLRATD